MLGSIVALFRRGEAIFGSVNVVGRGGACYDSAVVPREEKKPCMVQSYSLQEGGSHVQFSQFLFRSGGGG